MNNIDISGFNFDAHEGGAVGVAQDDGWAFPSMGYDAKQGFFNSGNRDEETFAQTKVLKDVQVIALRESKVVKHGDEKVARYPLIWAKAKMVAGEVAYHSQLMIYYEDQIQLIGAWNLTSRRSISNPKGKYMTQGIERPIIQTLDAYREAVMNRNGVNLPYFSFLVDISPYNYTVTVGTSKKQDVYPFEAVNVRSATAESAAMVRDLFDSEDVAGWIAEWSTPNTGMSDALAAGSRAQQNQDSVDDIPF